VLYLTTYNNLGEIPIFYEVKNAIVTEIKVTRTSYYTDSAGTHNLVELEYDDFGRRSVNLIKNLIENTFEMRFENRFITTDVRRAIRIALASYKRGDTKYDSLPECFETYYDEYPELFL